MTLAILGGTPVGSTADHGRWPVYDEEDKAAVAASLDGRLGDVIPQAEAQIAAYFGVRHAYLVSSGTMALTAGQVALGIDHGDDVLQAAYSFPATPHSTVAAGGYATFGDVLPGTVLLDPDQIHARMTPTTRLILPVAMEGHLAFVREYRAAADEYRLPILWDAAQAAGARCGRLGLGDVGDAIALSLNDKKVLSARQGGALLTDNAEIDRKAREYGHYGRGIPTTPMPSYWTERHGVNAASTDMVAALAMSRLSRLDGFLAVAQRNMSALWSGLGDLAGLILPAPDPEGSVSTWSRPRVRIDPTRLGWRGSLRRLRGLLVTALRAEGLPVRSWLEYPLPCHPEWRDGTFDAVLNDFPATRDLLDGSIMLFDDPYAIWAQTPHVLDHYVGAFRKVWGLLDAVMYGTFAIVEPSPMPAVPAPRGGPG